MNIGLPVWYLFFSAIKFHKSINLQNSVPQEPQLYNVNVGKVQR